MIPPARDGPLNHAVPRLQRFFPHRVPHRLWTNRPVSGLDGRMIRRILALACFSALSFFNTVSAQEAALPPKEQFHLFLLTGQSNMAGRGVVEDQDKKPHPRVLMLNKEGKWVPAADPLHWDKSSAGTGLGKSFGQTVAEANPGVTIGLIPCAHGGSPIDSWRPGVYYAATKGHPWDDAIKRATLAMQSGTLKGILWHQGESDCKPGLAEAYEAKLHDLVARFRKELNAPDLPFIAGQIGKFEGVDWSVEAGMVDAAHRSLPKHVPGTAFVSSEGLKHKGDKVHFDSASLREFGKRYAEQYAKLTATVRQP